MRYLFVARHGEYGDDDGRLNQDGFRQMETLGRYMKQILNGGSVYLVSSAAPRALDSSEVLAAQLGLTEFEKMSYLWSGKDAEDGWDYKSEGLMQIVEERRERADGLVMVTHLEIVDSFPTRVMEKLGKPSRIGEVKKGRAVCIDFDDVVYRLIPEQAE